MIYMWKCLLEKKSQNPEENEKEEKASRLPLQEKTKPKPTFFTPYQFTLPGFPIQQTLSQTQYPDFS